MIKIIIIDKNEADRTRLHTLMASQQDMAVVGMGKDGYDALTLVESKKPHIMIMDASGERDSGIVPRLKRKFPLMSIIFLTPHPGEEPIRNALRHNVQALVLKNADPDHLITAIRHVRQGRRFTSPDLRDKTYRICSRLIKNMDPSQNRTEGPAKNPETSSLLDTITNTEMGIMLCIAQGHSTKEVAKRFQFTDGTVRNYLSSGMKKTGLKRRTQIHQLFLKQGLL